MVEMVVAVVATMVAFLGGRRMVNRQTVTDASQIVNLYRQEREILEGKIEALESKNSALMARISVLEELVTKAADLSKLDKSLSTRFDKLDTAVAKLARLT